MKRTWVILFSALALGLLLIPAILAQGTPSIDWAVISGGGGSASSGGKSLDGVIGQWAVSSNVSGTTQLGSGFWGGGGAEVGRQGFQLFLPLICKGYGGF